MVYLSGAGSAYPGCPGKRLLNRCSSSRGGSVVVMFTVYCSDTVGWPTVSTSGVKNFAAVFLKCST